MTYDQIDREVKAIKALLAQPDFTFTLSGAGLPDGPVEISFPAVIVPKPDLQRLIDMLEGVALTPSVVNAG